MKQGWLAALALILTVPLHADEVPQFRGTGGLGIAKARNLPVKWSATENVRWKAALPGRGLSNPVLAGGRIYLTATAAYQQKREVVLCFDLQTGKKLWERQVWATGTTLSHPKTNMAAPTPITDGERVYALFATGDLVCYDRDGDLVWYRSLVGDYPTVGNNVGMAASPTLWNDLLLVCLENVGESFAAGIDKRTGENRWRVERPRGINWVTPLVFQNHGQAELLCQSDRDLTAYDLASGKKKWSMTKQRFATIPSPTCAGDVVYAPGDKFLALRPGVDAAEPEVLWQSLKLRPGYCSPVVHEGLVYVVNGNGILHCAQARTGDIVWTHRLEGSYSASPLLADGKLYLVNEEGLTTVMRAGDQAKVLATNALKDSILASPVATDGALFLRSDTTLYCIGEKSTPVKK